jgi:hypothetical protein
MSSQVTVTRYYGPEGPEEVWRVVSEALGWVAYGPAGAVFAPQSSLVEALEVSGACRFEEGVALHISGADPFALLPALRGWADAPAGDPEDTSWEGHPVMGAAYPDDSWFSTDSGFSFDLSRPILVGDATVAVVGHPDAGSSRFLVVLDEARSSFGSLPIVLSDTWAEASTDNGWGRGLQQIGELAPGLIGDISQVDDILTVDIRPSRPGKDERLYEQMVTWAYEKVEFAFSGYDYTLDFSGGSITVSFKDEEMSEEQDLVSGFFGPAVLRSVRADAAGGAE